MALSVQNKNFLSLLHKLEIDINQFPDKTFDGLFDNVPENVNIFFNWFMENVSSDNVLTRVEDICYFELEKSEQLPNEKEVDLVFSTFKPSYEDLQNIEVNFIKNLLPEELGDLMKTNNCLSDILQKIEQIHNEVKKVLNGTKETINIWRKQLNENKGYSDSIYSSINKIANDIKFTLLNKPENAINILPLEELLHKEELLFEKLDNMKLVEHQNIDDSSFPFVPELNISLKNAETALLLTQGNLFSKKAQISALSEMLKNKIWENSKLGSLNYLNVNDNEEAEKSGDLINKLEVDLYNKIEKVCTSRVEKAMEEYILEKKELESANIAKFVNFKNYKKTNCDINMWLLHFLVLLEDSLKKHQQSRNECFSNLVHINSNFDNNVRSFELKKQKYREVSNTSNIEPFFKMLQSVLKAEVDFANEQYNATLKSTFKLFSKSSDDPNFVIYDLRNKVQSSIKCLYQDVLCGPTNSVLLVPLNLLIHFQKCEKFNTDLTQQIKYLVNKYLKLKDSLSKSDRRNLLLWIDFLTQSSNFKKMKNCSNQVDSI